MDAVEWGAYEMLRPAQIDAIKAEAPIAYLPWGALEWHGVHNPVGLDALKARKLCEALARETGGVVLPPVYAGTDTMKPFKGFKHTIEHRRDTVKALCADYLEQLADEGFKVIVLVMGHYGSVHVQALLETIEAFTAEHPGVRIWAFPDYEPVESDYPGNHAARGETAYQMLFHPDTVDLSALPAGRAITLDQDGVMGDDPRTAAAEYGAEMLAAFVAAAAPKVKAMLAAGR